MKHFTYLGSTITDDCSLDMEIETRIKKASVSYDRLKKRLWDTSNISLKTKISVFQAVVISTLLYGCETWTCYRKHIKLLERFQIKHLKFILRIRWQELLPDKEILSWCNTISIEAQIAKHRLRWAGHVMRMASTRIPKKVFLSEMKNGKRDTGRPKLRY